MSSTDTNDNSQVPQVLPPIFLLKTPSTPRDTYEEYFRNNTFPLQRRQEQQQSETSLPVNTGNTEEERGEEVLIKYDPIFVPVLSHRFHAQNLGVVRSLFLSNTAEENHNHSSDDNGKKELNGQRDNAFVGSRRKYGGIIFTSQRAVEAFGDVLERGDIPVDITTSTSQAMLLYTVGPATARTLTPIRNKHLPHATIYGDEAGNGENLAHLILEHYNERCRQHHDDVANETKPGLLFLVGEQRRDIIPKTLMSEDLDESQRIQVDELVVYETAEMERFEDAFRDAVRSGEEVLDSFLQQQQQQQQVSNEEEQGDVHIWIVIFSPTGCDAVLRTLNIPSSPSSGGNDSKRKFLIATIGPTTRNHLVKNYGFEPDVVAQKPSPEGVGEGIRDYYLRNL